MKGGYDLKSTNRLLPAILILFTICINTGCGTNISNNPKPAPERSAGLKATDKTPSQSDRLQPWDSDPDFSKARKVNGTPRLISAYKATLPDPLWAERENIALAADYLRGAVVQPGQVFSLNARIGPRIKERGFKPGPMYQGNKIVPTTGGGICKVASVLYNAVVGSTLEVVERHAHSMTVPYVPPGQDATISSGTKDFRFRNSFDEPILIWSKGYAGTLHIGIYGSTNPPKVNWKHRILSKQPTRTITRIDPGMAPGMSKLEHEGSEGLYVHSWVIVTEGNGGKQIKDMGISTYKPCPRTIIKGWPSKG